MQHRRAMPAALIIPLFIGGCFMPTKQPDASQVRAVSEDRMFSIPDQGTDTGTVVVTRDIGAVGSGCALGVMVDGDIAVHLETAESFTVQLRPGRHLLTATGIDGRGLCAFSNTKSNLARRRSTEIYVDAGVTRRYRLSYTSVESPPVIEATL